jgi:hypothetical protein
MIKFKQLRENFLTEGMSKQMPIEKYAKKIGIDKEEQQWILDNEADMIVYEPNQNKANSFMALSYPVNDGDYYFAFLTGKSTDPQDKMKALASKENAKMNKYLKALVKKNSASMGDSNLAGFVYNEMNKQFEKLPRQLGAGDTMTREELAYAVEDATRAEIMWEGTFTPNKPQIAEGIFDTIMNKLRNAGKKIKKKLGRKAKTNLESKEVNEAKSYPDRLVQKAVKIAFDKKYYMGNMTGAINAIEKLKKGLSDDPVVMNALRLANESVNEGFMKNLNQRQIKRKYGRVIKKTLDKGSLEFPADAEEALFGWAFDHGEIATDDPDEFIDWLDKNAEDFSA